MYAIKFHNTGIYTVTVQNYAKFQIVISTFIWAMYLIVIYRLSIIDHGKSEVNIL